MKAQWPVPVSHVARERIPVAGAGGETAARGHGPLRPRGGGPRSQTGPAHETEDRRIRDDDDATGSGFYRLEGVWYGDGSIFVISTNGGDPLPGGDPGLGQVWQYIPRGNAVASWC